MFRERRIHFEYRRGWRRPVVPERRQYLHRPTTVNAGVILGNGSTAAASAVTVNGGGVLAGTGTIGGPVTVAGGVLSPGVSSPAIAIGTLTVNKQLTLAGDVLIEVNKSLAPSNDMVSVSGTLTNTRCWLNTGVKLRPGVGGGRPFQDFQQAAVKWAVAARVVGGTEVWTNKLAVDGSIEVLSATNTPITGNPTRVLRGRARLLSTSLGRRLCKPPPTGSRTRPHRRCLECLRFSGRILVPYNWPYVDTNYGTSILIFSNNAVLNSIKILAGSNHTVNLGSYVRQDTAMPCYFGITGPVPIVVGGVTYTVNNAYFTNALGDVSCGSQTEFQCTGGRLDVYGRVDGRRRSAQADWSRAGTTR